MSEEVAGVVSNNGPKVAELQKLVSEICEAAKKLCSRIEAEGGHGHEVHELSKNLQLIADTVSAQTDSSDVIRSCYLFVGGKSHGKTIGVADGLHEVEVEGECYQMRELHIGKSFVNVCVLKSIGNSEAIKSVLNLAMNESANSKSVNPYQVIYESILSKAKERASFTPDVWMARERENVWHIARSYAMQNGLRVLTMKEVEEAEMSACFYVDYAAKWAFYVAERMMCKQ